MSDTAASDPPIDEALIETLVRRFYDRIRTDPDLGPIFEEAIPGDWEPHLQNMMRFWSSVMLRTGRFKGQPVQTHLALSRLTAEHFPIWLRQFRITAKEVCPPEAATAFITRAEMIARSLQSAVATSRQIQSLSMAAPAKR